MSRGVLSHGRRRSGHAVPVALLAVGLALGGLTPAAAQPTLDELREQVRRAQSARQQAEAERARVEERRRRVESERDGLRDELAELEARQARLSVKLQEATAEVERLVAELAVLTDEVAELERQVASLEQEAAASRADLRDRVRAIYKGAAPNEYLGLLESGSASDAAFRTHYLTALSRHDRAAVEVAAADARRVARAQAEHEDAVERTKVVKAEAERAQAELDRRLVEVGRQHDAIARKVAERERAAERLVAEAAELRRVADRASRAERDGRERVHAEEARIERERQERQRREQEQREQADAERRAAQQAEERRRAEEEARRLAQAEQSSRSSSGSDRTSDSSSRSSRASSGSSGSSGGAGGGRPASARGGLVCPQDHPRSFTDTWGAPRSGGRRHQGTDVFGSHGGRVLAITSGVIEFTRTGAVPGLFLSLRGDDGNTYWYMHLDTFRASPGQRVSAGQVIATNGDTGNARGTSPHIHFELHPGGGGPVNPYPLLRRVCR